MIRLRAATESDLDFLLALEHQYHLEGFVCTDSREVHEQRMASRDARYFVVESEGRAAGTLIVRGLDSPHRSIELKRVCIAAPGAGTGREAIRQFLQMAFEEWNAHRVWLDVYPENERARRTYAALGFKQEGSFRECIFQQGRFRSLIVMSMLEGEYRRPIPSA